MLNRFSSIPSTVKACGFSLLVGAGCQQPPDWAEEANPDDIQILTDSLDEAEDSLDLGEAVAKRMKPMFVEDKDNTSPTAAQVRAEQQSDIDLAREMIMNGQVYVYRGARFPDEGETNEDKKMEQGAGFADYSWRSGLEYVVLLEDYLSDIETVIHEFDHVLHNAGHPDAVVAEIKVGYPKFDTVVSERDFSYRDSYIFDMIQVIDDGQLIYDYMNESDYEMSSYDNFKAFYGGMSYWIDAAQNNTAEWGPRMAADIMDYGELFFDQAGITEEELAEIYTLPETKYIRDHLANELQKYLDMLIDANPEYYAQYRLEMLKEGEMKPQPLPESARFRDRMK